MDYIRTQCSRAVPKPKAQECGEKSADDSTSENQVSGGGRDSSQDRRVKAKDARRRRRSTSRSPRQSESDKSRGLDCINVIGVQNEEWFKATVTQNILEMRKIVVCLVRGVDLTPDGLLKRFITLQTGINLIFCAFFVGIAINFECVYNWKTGLHTGICGQRQHATIATHDLSRIVGKQIHFDVRPPSKIRFVPLNRQKEVSAAELYKQLNEEAEAYRKEKKRQSYSGIHKYLFLLKGKQRYPCVMDGEGDQRRVISLPPLINSETTKVWIKCFYACLQFLRGFPLFIPLDH